MYGLLGRLSSSSSSGSGKSQRKQKSGVGLAESLSFSEINHGMSSLKVPDFVPSPNEDCDRLKKSFDGLGTDEKEVIRILGHRNESQRRIIRQTYYQLYNESLIDRLFSELSGDFRKAMIWWMSDPAERDAKMAHEALKMGKKGLKYTKIIVEIACASSPHHLMAVRQAYCSLYDSSLEEDVASSVSSSSRKLLLGLVSSYRYDKEVIDLGVANMEASLLHTAIKAKQLDHDHVVWVLGTRNVYQLRATFERYEKIVGNSIYKDIKSCGSGDLSSLLRVVVNCLDTPEKHFAEVIRESIVGLGTDEDSLSRAIVTRAEIDTVKIREQYRQLYKNNLEADVIGDTSGDYKDLLLTLLGENI